MPMNGNNANPEQERAKYVRAFNSTMIKIWREQQTLLGTVDTGALYRSTVAVGMTADGKFTSVTLSQSFRTYGIFVDYGTGSNTPRGNSGDLGAGFTNRRLSTKSLGSAKNRKRWFSRKYFASVMNIQEFFADNLGRDCCLAIANALNPDLMRRSVIL